MWDKEHNDTHPCVAELMLYSSGIAGIQRAAMVVHVYSLTHSQIIYLVCVDKRSCDTFWKSSGLLCSILAGMFTNSSGGCYSLILLKASTPLRQNSYWSHREFFMPSTCRIVPMNVEHFRVPWEETITLKREMSFPLLQYSKNLCMVTVYKILQGKYKWKTIFPSFCFD